MIKIMRTVLKLNHADDAYAFQRGEISLGALCDRVIPSILDRIEKEGMLPPEVDRWIEGVLCGESKWEDENEEN
jgi:hypothetical protein